MQDAPENLHPWTGRGCCNLNAVCFMMSFMIIMILWEKSVPKNDATACLSHQVLCNLNFLEKWSSDSKVKLKFCAINNDWIEAAVSDSERRAHTPGAALARRVSPVRNLRTRTDIRLGYKYHATDHFLIKSRLRFQADEYLISWIVNHGPQHVHQFVQQEARLRGPALSFRATLQCPCRRW